MALNISKATCGTQALPYAFMDSFLHFPSEIMGKLFGYHTLGVLLKSLSDSCFRADEQEKRGEKVTACGMSSDEIEDLCENYLPYALNPMMSTEEVKEKLHVSDATLNRMVARGDIPNGECKKRGHTRYFKKWDILHYIKSKRKS